MNPPPRSIFLSRDGVINRRLGYGFVRDWQHFEFLPAALDGLRLLARHSYEVLVFCNQLCLPSGSLSCFELYRFTQRMLLEVTLAGGNISGVYYTSLLPRCQWLSARSHIHLLQLALTEHHLLPEDTHFISDSPTDLAVARCLGCPTIALCREAFLNPQLFGDSVCGQVVSNLREAVELVIRHDEDSTLGTNTSWSHPSTPLRA